MICVCCHDNEDFILLYQVPGVTLLAAGIVLPVMLWQILHETADHSSFKHDHDHHFMVNLPLDLFDINSTNNNTVENIPQYSATPVV